MNILFVSSLSDKQFEMNFKMDDKDIVITSAFRTPIGSLLGSLADHPATQLGTEVIKKCIQDSKLKSNEVDMVYMGQVLQTGSGQNPARQSLINSGINNSKTAKDAGANILVSGSTIFKENNGNLEKNISLLRKN